MTNNKNLLIIINEANYSGKLVKDYLQSMPKDLPVFSKLGLLGGLEEHLQTGFDIRDTRQFIILPEEYVKSKNTKDFLEASGANSTIISNWLMFQTGYSWKNFLGKIETNIGACQFLPLQKVIDNCKQYELKDSKEEVNRWLEANKYFREKTIKKRLIGFGSPRTVPITTSAGIETLDGRYLIDFVVKEPVVIYLEEIE